MSRVVLLSDDTTDPTVARVYERVRTALGYVPNLYRMLGNAPNLLEAWVDFAWQLRHDAVSGRGTRELLIMRTSQLNVTDYEWRGHRGMALEHGITADQLRELATWRVSDLFDESQRAVLALADELADSTHVSSTTWAALHDAFDDRQVVELLLTGAFYACVSRVINGLQVPLDEGHYAMPSLHDGR